MTRNEFIHRAIIAQMANPYAWGKDNNPFRMSYSDIIDIADNMADYVEESGIHFDALPMEGEKKGVKEEFDRYQEERLNELKAERNRLCMEISAYLDDHNATYSYQLNEEDKDGYNKLWAKYNDAREAIRDIYDARSEKE